MDQYLYIPFLGGWTSIYQLFWCSPGVQGFDPLPYNWWLSWNRHCLNSLAIEVSGILMEWAVRLRTSKGRSPLDLAAKANRNGSHNSVLSTSLGLNMDPRPTRTWRTWTFCRPVGGDVSHVHMCILGVRLLSPRDVFLLPKFRGTDVWTANCQVGTGTEDRWSVSGGTTMRQKKRHPWTSRRPPSRWLLLNFDKLHAQVTSSDQAIRYVIFACVCAVQCSFLNWNYSVLIELWYSLSYMAVAMGQNETSASFEERLFVFLKSRLLEWSEHVFSPISCWSQRSDKGRPMLRLTIWAAKTQLICLAKNGRAECYPPVMAAKSPRIPYNVGLSENRVYSQWNNHLIGIMISKTIGFRGFLYFQTHPCEYSKLS